MSQHNSYHGEGKAGLPLHQLDLFGGMECKTERGEGKRAERCALIGRRNETDHGRTNEDTRQMGIKSVTPARRVLENKEKLVRRGKKDPTLRRKTPKKREKEGQRRGVGQGSNIVNNAM